MNNLSNPNLKLPVSRLMYLLIPFMLLMASCKDDEGTIIPPEEPDTELNLQEVAADRDELSSFLAAVEQAGLSSALTDASNELTVFAPNNEAFETFLSQAGVTLADVPQEQLQDILQYHIVEGRVLSNQLTNGNVNALNGGEIAVNIDNGVTLNNTSGVVTADLEASNGVIHIIDEVLTEEEPEPDDTSVAARIGAEEDLSILADILAREEFSDIAEVATNPESNLTVFAPTNSYFEALLADLGRSSLEEIPETVLRDIVTYHILGEAYAAADLESNGYTSLQGEDLIVSTEDGVTVDGIAVSAADLEASNGYVHKIDGVLLPSESRAAGGTVAGIAYFDANFTTLVAAIREAELLGALLEEGPFTVFAPTNQAFEAAGITDVSAIPQDQLQDILLYHVVSGNVTSDMLEAGAVGTLSEDELYVSLNDNGVFLNGNTQVTQADVAADNGVVHVIDNVLMPPMQNLAEIVVAQASAEEAEFTLLLRAVERAGLVEALSGDDVYTVFAPTDGAFEAAGFNADAIDSTDPATLQAVLLYHVVEGRVFSANLTDGDVTTLQGGNVTINTADLSLTDEREGSANLNAEMLDILATNGVIHVIDAVILPAE